MWIKTRFCFYDSFAPMSLNVGDDLVNSSVLYKTVAGPDWVYNDITVLDTIPFVGSNAFTCPITINDSVSGVV